MLRSYFNDVDVRALLALLLVGVVAVGFLMGRVENESVVQLASTAVGFYFAAKAFGTTSTSSSSSEGVSATSSSGGGSNVANGVSK